MSDPQPWWQNLYDELLAETLLVRKDPAALEATTRFLISALDLGPGSRVFDQCCGIGSLSIPLARAGATVVGVDLGEGYAERGQRAADAEGLDVRLEAGDAFSFVPRQPCDSAINWWTSFGYADTDEENGAMLDRAFEALVPGGRFALDTMNVPGVLQRFAPEVVTERDTPLGHVVLRRTSRYEAATGRIHKEWRYTVPGRPPVTHQSSVRAHTPVELGALLSAAGFRDITFVGSVAGEPLELSSPRCIALARRPK